MTGLLAHPLVTAAALLLAALPLSCGPAAVNTGPLATTPGPALPPATPATSGAAAAETGSIPDVRANSALDLSQTDAAARYHEVQAGETLSAIGQRYGVTAEQLSRANGLGDPNRIQPGQVLYIPEN